MTTIKDILTKKVVTPVDIPNIADVMDIPDQELPKGFVVITHPYKLAHKGVKFSPNSSGVYEFKNEKEKQALEYWVAKGFIGFRE